MTESVVVAVVVAVSAVPSSVVEMASASEISLPSVLVAQILGGCFIWVQNVEVHPLAFGALNLHLAHLRDVTCSQAFKADAPLPDFLMSPLE